MQRASDQSAVFCLCEKKHHSKSRFNHQEVLMRSAMHWLSVLWIAAGLLEAKSRARDLGAPFEGSPGPSNAITDVRGVEVGHTTLIRGDGPLRVGQGPVRTGVTIILPRGKRSKDPVFAGWFSLNGNGEMTGTTWVEESGFMEGPMAITNTHSVGVVRDALIDWQKPGMAFFSNLSRCRWSPRRSMAG